MSPFPPLHWFEALSTRIISEPRCISGVVSEFLGEKNSHFVCRYHCHLAGETPTNMYDSHRAVSKQLRILAVSSVKQESYGGNSPTQAPQNGRTFLSDYSSSSSTSSTWFKQLLLIHSRINHSNLSFYSSVRFKRTEATRLSLHDCHPKISPGVAEGSTTNPPPLLSKFWDQSKNSDFKTSEFYGLNQKYGASQDQLLYFLLFFACSISPRSGHSTEEGERVKERNRLCLDPSRFFVLCSITAP